MRALAATSALLLAVLLAPAAAPAAQPPPDPRTAQQLRDLEGAIDELTRRSDDALPEQRASRGERLNRAFVALTGEAINPLFGITALGMYNYFRTDEGSRHLLPVYDQPEIWIPLLILILLMLFNSTICEAMPFLKVPLNALGDIVNKAGAIAVLPLVVKMFADAMAQPAAREIARLADFLAPAAFAAEAGLAGGLWTSLGWLAGAAIGTVVYMAVWLTFNVIDVLILLCPFPGVDALLKSFRLSMIGVLAGSYQFSPTLALILSLAVVAVSFLIAGWSFRLSVFGWFFSTDILFFRRREIAGEPLVAFASDVLCRSRGVPMRTLGRLETDSGGGLVFSYRPWLVLGRRRAEMGPAASFACGRGLINPAVVETAKPNGVALRLPPRYRKQETAIVGKYSLSGVIDCGVAKTLREWFTGQMGCEKSPAGAP